MLPGTEPQDGDDRGPRDRREPLSVAETAFLAGGTALLAQSTLVDLVEQDAVAVRDTSVMVRGRRAPADRVGADLWQQLRASGRTSVQRAVDDMTRSPAVVAVEVDLAGRGLLPDRGARRRRQAIRCAMAVLGLAGLLAGILAVVGDGPAGPAFALATVALASAALIPSLRRTKAGSAALTAARDEHAGLVGGGLPGQRSRAVALFGVEVLRDSHPNLALLLGASAGTTPLSLQEQVARRRTERRRAPARRLPAAGGSIAAWWGLGGSPQDSGGDGGPGHTFGHTHGHDGGHVGGHDGGGSSCGGSF